LELDPTIKMIIYVAPLIALQLLFPLFSLILMASYFKGIVIVCIAIIILANAAVLNFEWLKKKCFCDISLLYGHFDHKMQRGQKESAEILNTAIVTSWISPCTVWSNNFKFKSYFLIVSSITALLGHAVGILSVFILTRFGYLLVDLSLSENPPVTHCFRNQDKIFLR
jgi:hypothetical protein